MLGFSKRGNCYLRKLFVQGAGAVLQFGDRQYTGLRHWLAEVLSRSHYNVVGVALAHKAARMAGAVPVRSEAYRPPALAGTLTGCRWRPTSTGLGNRSAIPTSKSATTAKLRILPDLLANHEMAQRSNPALPNSEL